MRQAVVSPLLNGGREAQEGQHSFPPKRYWLVRGETSSHLNLPKPQVVLWNMASSALFGMCVGCKIEIACLLIRGFRLGSGRNVLDQGTALLFENWKTGKKSWILELAAAAGWGEGGCRAEWECLLTGMGFSGGG